MNARLGAGRSDVYQKFINGHHVIRRSDRFWAGLSSDLIIEQVLMGSLKSTGGLTRGTGMGEEERFVWLLGMPACTEIRAAMQHLTDNAKVVGMKILQTIAEKKLADISLKKSDQAVILAVKTAVTVREESVVIDPNLFFQRLVGPDILLDDNTLLFESKDTFLSNPNNKQRFIDKLSKALTENGFHTAHASGDADCLIVQTSLKRARESQSTAKAVKKAGEKALVQLLGGEGKDTLDSLRHVKYMQKLSSHSGTMAVQPQKLPPTSAAAKFHSTRVYLQVQEWKHLRETLSLTAWGWELKDNTLFPTYTTKAVAPDDLLCIIKCNCKADCSTDRCSCRRHGRVCSAAYGECRGECCMNSIVNMEKESFENASDNESDC
ncbi:hypothetical protein BaRGS_00000384 [Batillaria attramentaria]|uniref:Tesmin/TSO1-like CXC domain-containing protein n=1 Tax=Batillaria attramentaria TaxID=370345 RepID=A0ABD0M890_9CAEN